MRASDAPALAIAATSALLLGCAGPKQSWLALTPTPEAYAAVDVDAVRVYPDVREADFPALPLRIARARLPRGWKPADEGLLFRAVRTAGAQRGANAVLRHRTERGELQFVAVRLDAAGFQVADRLVVARAGGGGGVRR
jgi:hypothetical protein